MFVVVETYSLARIGRNRPFVIENEGSVDPNACLSVDRTSVEHHGVGIWPIEAVLYHDA